MVSALIFTLLFLWVVGFSFLFFKLTQKNDYVLLLGGLVPGMLILTYGLGSTLLLINEPQYRFDFYQCNFSDLDLLLVTIYAILSSIIYFASFLISGKGFISKKENRCNWRNQFSIDVPKVSFIIAILLPLDLVVRFLRLDSGTYSNWVAAHVSNLPWWKTALFQFQSFSCPLLGILLYAVAKEKKWARIFLFLLISLVIFEGDRSTLLFFLISILLAFMYFNMIKPSFKILAFSSIFMVFFFGFLGPLIQEIRYDIRDDIDLILDNPKTLPMKIVTEYVPVSLKVSRLYGDESRRKGSGSLIKRFSSWPAFWASINSRIFDGFSFQGIDKAVQSISLIVPSIFYPGQKPIIRAGPDNLAWFDLFVSSNDPTSTVFVDAFTIGGLWALLFFSIIYGALSGLWIRIIINNFKSFGVMIVFGLTNIFLISKDSFATVFTSFRNSILLVLFLVISYWCIRETEKYLRK